MKVKEFISSYCSLSLLDELSFESDYWKKCSDFIEQNSHREVEVLSDKQKDWLHSIKEDLIEEANK